MRIGICEDEQIIREQLTMLMKAYPTDEPIEVAAYVTGEDLLADTKGFDLVFLDIELGSGISGLEAAEILQTRPRRVLIVFISSHYRYITRAQHLEPFEFLVKPIEQELFNQEFERCLKRYHGDRQYYIINHFGEDIPLRIAEIIYIKVVQYKLYFYMLGRVEPYEIYGHLKEVKKALLPHQFALANQGCLINLRYVYGSANDDVKLVYHDKKGHHEVNIPVSRRQKKELQQRIRNFMLEGGANDNK